MFWFARLLVGAGVGLFIWLFFTDTIFHRFWMGLLPIGYFVFLVVLQVWTRRFAQQTVYQNHDWAFGTSLGTSGAFWGFLCIEYLLQ